MSEILINPDQVEQKASEMEKLVKNLKLKIEEVNGTATSLKEVWQDTVQENYESDFTRLSQNFHTLTDSLPAYIAQAHNHADIMRRLGQNG